MTARAMAAAPHYGERASSFDWHILGQGQSARAYLDRRCNAPWRVCAAVDMPDCWSVSSRAVTDDFGDLVLVGPWEVQ